MKITNKTKSTVLADNAFYASSLCDRMRGLLGRASLKPKEALILKPCNSVHTFFMRFSIDVVFVDKDNRVVKTISCLKPFRLSPIAFGGSLAVELPAGVVKETLTDSGDYLLIE